MYPAAETVAANVQTLAATAAKAQAVSVDEVMAKEMPLATKEVNDACKRLLDATLNLRDDPSSAAEQKNMVLAAEGPPRRATCTWLLTFLCRNSARDASRSRGL